MAETLTQDEVADLTVRERRRTRRWVAAVGLAGGGASWAAIPVLQALDGARGVRLMAHPVPLSSPVADAFIGMGVAAMATGIVLARRYRPGADFKRMQAAPGQRDRMQASYALWLLIGPLIGLAYVAAPLFSTRAILAGHATATNLWIAGAGAVVFVWPTVFALINAGRGALEGPLAEELIRHLRAQALNLGYVTVMITLAGLFWLGLFNPKHAVEIMPLALLLGVAAPAWRLAYLHRRAEQD